MAATYPNMLAGGVDTVGAFAPFQLWAGESDIVTSQAKAAEVLAQFRVAALNAAGELIKWDPAGAAPANKAVGFTAQAGVIGDMVPYFTGGVPNHEALVWPVAVTTLGARRVAFAGSNINVGQLL